MTDGGGETRDERERERQRKRERKKGTGFAGFGFQTIDSLTPVTPPLFVVVFIVPGLQP